MTKEERHKVYIEMLNVIKESETYKKFGYYDAGLCYALYEVNFTFWLNEFPELIKHQPDDYDYYWFKNNVEGTQKRISILNQAIKETE